VVLRIWSQPQAAQCADAATWCCTMTKQVNMCKTKQEI
jgi:hypothetical protein